MRVIVLDETMELGCRAHEVLAPLGVKMTFAGAVQELLVMGRMGPDDLLLVNLGGELGGWQVADCLRRTGFQGRTLVLHGNRDREDRYLRELPTVQCIEQPASPEVLDQLLRRLVAEGLEAAAGNDGLPGSPADADLSPGARVYHGMVARSRVMLDIFARIDKVAAGTANVCIYGESGTGKELIARAIHDSSERRDGPLITLDCTAIPEGLMESHLFGHVKGAFTGAVDHREGVFALANAGTLFIDELCELSLPLQAKLLRVIQAREFTKVGGAKAIRTNIRLVTATNKDPKKEVDSRNFREDLYYRVAVVMIKVPALRERREDIPLLVDHFLQKFSAVYRKPPRRVPDRVMERLMGLPWPGNVRQLENFLEQAVVLSDGEALTEGELPVDDYYTPGAKAVAPLQLEPGLPLREVERRYILRTLQKVHGNRTQAAKLLGISTRCLQYKLKTYYHDARENELERPLRRVAGGPLMARGM